MNSSASKLGLIECARLRDEFFPSLNDPETVNGAGVTTVESIPVSPENSSMTDLANTETKQLALSLTRTSKCFFLLRSQKME
jgi:hypothetical protein